MKKEKRNWLKRLVKELEVVDRMTDGKISSSIIVVNSFLLIILLVILSIIW